MRSTARRSSSFAPASASPFIRLLSLSLIAGVIGLLAGLGRVSTNTVIRTLSVTYVEFIRGVPMLVLIFTVALVIVPTVSGWLGLGIAHCSSCRAA